MLHHILERIRWLGHDGFIISDGKIHVAIDPYRIAEGVAQADLILVTHPHFDHCSPADIHRLATPRTIIVADHDSSQKLSGDVRTLTPGERLHVEGVTIEAVPAYNINKDFHPQNKRWLGYIITLAGIRIYHAGDTDLIPEMDDFTVDIALLPVSGTYVMNAEEAAAAAKRIGPQYAIPMHYGSFVGSASDASRFRQALQGICEVRMLTP